jgi:hypothetical protein
MRLLPLAALLAGAGIARADDPVPLDEHTAHLVGDGRLKLGLLSFEYGLTRDLSIGIDTPAWVARVFSPVFAPNAHLKGAFVTRPTWIVGGQVGVYYARLTDTDAGSGALWVVPAALLGSVSLTPRLWVHGELNYNWARGVGSGDIGKVEIDGAVATRTGQVGAMVEYHLTRVVGLIARGRYQVFSTPLVLRGGQALDAYTDVELAAEVRPENPHPWMAVGGLAFTWAHVGLVLGAGYGHYFVPGANLAVSSKRVIPEGSFWVRF